MVIKIGDKNLHQKAGIVGKTHRTWCAIKFPADEVTTKVLDIIWQVGRTGKVTPVAILEPVLLQGSTVTKATLHNFKQVLDLSICKNDYVIIRKAGDIIPEIVKILPELSLDRDKVFELPTNCPSCSQKLDFSDTQIDLICNNLECPDKIILRLSYFCSRNLANIEGMSQKTLTKFVQLYGIKDICDIYKLDFEAIAMLDGFGYKSAQKLQLAVEKSRKIQDYKFLAGLGIDGIGPEVAKLICELL
jgi:DNA ligase (NAD+)